MTLYITTSMVTGSSWPWSYGSWIYNYLCIHCLSPLILWVQISIRARCTTSCYKVCQWLATGRWFSPGPSVSSTNKTWPPRHIWNIVESGVTHHQTNINGHGDSVTFCGKIWYWSVAKVWKIPEFIFHIGMKHYNFLYCRLLMTRSYV